LGNSGSSLPNGSSGQSNLPNLPTKPVRHQKRTQRYRCQACEHYLTPDYQRGYEQAMRDQAVPGRHQFACGLPIMALARDTGLAVETQVMLERSFEQMQQFADHLPSASRYCMMPSPCTKTSSGLGRHPMSSHNRCEETHTIESLTANLHTSLNALLAAVAALAAVSVPLNELFASSSTIITAVTPPYQMPHLDFSSASSLLTFAF
jgi:transposase-like protein